MSLFISPSAYPGIKATMSARATRRAAVLAKRTAEHERAQRRAVLRASLGIADQASQSQQRLILPVTQRGAPGGLIGSEFDAYRIQRAREYGRAERDRIARADPEMPF